MTIVDATVRLIPEVLGRKLVARMIVSHQGFWNFRTRPAGFRGMKVPDVLLSGHHVNIRRWRMERVA
ncbi:MAG: hypothetical protein ACLTZB_05860 [Streptococcus salivarius]